jgi:hypothetical protein
MFTSLLSRDGSERVDLLITARFASIPYDHPVRAPSAKPERSLSSAERPLVRLCNILTAFTISLEDFSEFPASLVSSNLNRCLLERVSFLRLLT